MIIPPHMMGLSGIFVAGGPVCASAVGCALYVVINVVDYDILRFVLILGRLQPRVRATDYEYDAA
jgi:hypothetical protein